MVAPIQPFSARYDRFVQIGPSKDSSHNSTSSCLKDLEVDGFDGSSLASCRNELHVDDDGIFNRHLPLLLCSSHVS